MHEYLISAVHATEQRLKKTSFFGLRFIVAVSLFSLYVLLACVHAFDVLFSSPQTSFAHLHALNKKNGYGGSYVEHSRWKHNVRFGALSYSLVLATTVVAATMFIQIVQFERFAQPVSAATFTVNSANTINDGLCDGVHCSINEALIAAVPFDIIKFSGDFTIIFNTTIAKNNLIIDGESNNIVFQCPDGNPTAFQLTGFNITLKNMTVQNCDQAGILVNTANFTLDNVTSQNNNIGALVDIDGNGGSILNSTFNNNTLIGLQVQNRSNMMIDNVVASNNGGDGIQLISGTNNVTIQNSDSFSNGSAGILVSLASDNTINNNNVGINLLSQPAANVAGISLDEASNNTVSNNTVSNNTNKGIAINNSGYATVTNNTSTNNGQAGITVENNSIAPTITLNTSSNNGGDGIFAQQVTGNSTISNNTVSNNTKQGITLNQLSQATVSNNTVTNNTSAGMYIGDANPSLTITGNTITGNQNGINSQSADSVSALAATTGATISNNTISNNTQYGMSLQRVTNFTISNNTVSNNTNDGMNFFGGTTAGMADGMTIQGNTVSSNGANGIKFDSGASGTVGLDAAGGGTGNTFTGNAVDVAAAGSFTSPVYIRGNSYGQNGTNAIQLINAANGGLEADDVVINNIANGIISGTTSISGGTIGVSLSTNRSAPASTYVGSTVADGTSWSLAIPEALQNANNVYVANVTQSGVGTSQFSIIQSIRLSAVTVSNVTDTTANVSWTTSKTANSTLVYIPVGGSATSVDVSTGTTSHLAELTGLEPGTQYNIVLTSRDSSELTDRGDVTVIVTTDEADDDTTVAPTISSISISDLQKDSATVNVTTDQATIANVRYGTTSSYGNTVNDGTSSTTHAIKLTGLDSATTYNYRVVVTNAGSLTATSANKQFTSLTDHEEKVTTFKVNGESVTSESGLVLKIAKEDTYFRFEDINNGDKVHLKIELLKKANNKVKKVIKNQKKSANSKNIVNFKVAEEKLKLFRDYKLSTGYIDSSNPGNNVALKKRFNFTVLRDEPQILFPTGTVVNGWPDEFIAYVRQQAGISVRFQVVDATTDEVKVSCKGTTDADGIASCTMPFQVPLGNYKLKVSETDGSSIATDKTLNVSAITDTLTFDSRNTPAYFKRIITTLRPNLTGLAFSDNSTIKLYPSFLNGASYDVSVPGTGIRSWYTTFTLFNWPKGEHSVRFEEVDADGVVQQSGTIPTLATYGAVQPALLSPADGASFTTAEAIIASFALPNDHTIEFYKDDTLVTKGNPVNGGVSFSLNSDGVGTHTYKARSINSLNIKSAFTTFTITVRRPAPVVITPEVTVPEVTETIDAPSTDTTNETTVVDEVDDDGDGINNSDEEAIGSDPSNPDTDGDGISDGDELADHTDPVNPDTDGDGIEDLVDEDPGNVIPENPNDSDTYDTDGDGISDADEIAAGTDPTKADTDDDGLTDSEEIEFGSDPTDSDSDDDEINDRLEELLETDPNDPESGVDEDASNSDEDKLSDEQEAKLGTDPKKSDSDKDGILDNEDGFFDVPLVEVDGLEQLMQEAADELYTEDGIQEPSDEYPLVSEQFIILTDDQRSYLQELLTVKLKQTDLILQSLKSSKTKAEVSEVDGVPVYTVTRKQTIGLRELLAMFLGDAIAFEADQALVLTGHFAYFTDQTLPLLLGDLPKYIINTNFSSPVVKVAQADTDGSWTMTVPVELLPAGEHVVYATNEINGVRGEQVEFARFVIKEETKLSNTTWLVIVNILIAILALVISIILQLRHRRTHVDFA